MTCIFSGKVFHDPTLSPKSRCIVGVGWDVLTDLIPAGKVKLLKEASGPIGRSAKALGGGLAKTRKFDKKLIDSLENLGDALKLVTHRPKDLVELFLTSDRSLSAIAKLVRKGHPKLVKEAVGLQGRLKKLFVALTGIDDYSKCKQAFSPPAPGPVLGSASTYPNGEGYGQSRPATIFFGGDPTSFVKNISWSQWGGATAIGTGIGDFVWPGNSVAGGSIDSPANIVAWDLGTCNGRTAYQKIEWYFPQYGQTFHPDQWLNVCGGDDSPEPSYASCGETDITSPPGYATDVQALGTNCATALTVVADSPSVEYLYDSESRFVFDGLYCGTQGYGDLSPPTLFECARDRIDILFEVTDTSG